MYLQTTIGNFSIVAHKSKKGVFLIRSRVKKDIQNFCTLAGFDEKEIIQSEYADYKYRVFVNQDVLMKFFFTYVENLDYPNFKGVMEKLYGNEKERWRINLIYEIYCNIVKYSKGK